MAALVTVNWSVMPRKRYTAKRPYGDAVPLSFILDMNREVDYTLLFSLNVAVALFVL